MIFFCMNPIWILRDYNIKSRVYYQSQFVIKLNPTTNIEFKT